MCSVPGLGAPELVGLDRGGQPEIKAQAAQGRSGWGRAGMEVTLGVVCLCVGEGHFVVFSLYTCFVLASDPQLQQPAHPPSKQWIQRPED